MAPPDERAGIHAKGLRVMKQLSVEQGRGYAYSTSVSDEAAMAVRDLLKNFGADAVDAFVNELSGDPGLLSQLERLLKEGPGL